MPLSDNVHGPSQMMPPEVLHVFYAGLLRYIFQSMQWYIGSKKLRDEIDKIHIRVSSDIMRQSDLGTFQEDQCAVVLLTTLSVNPKNEMVISSSYYA